MDPMSGVEKWVERHRLEGHHPHPPPTNENPERWDCDCGGVNRILTREQIAKKFAHLGAAKKKAEEQERQEADRRLRAVLAAKKR
jgi:hypothetical protein